MPIVSKDLVKKIGNHLRGLDKEEAFHHVREFLLSQGVKSVFDTDYCMYRGPNGTKCAIGCLIPDELYDPCIENVAASEFDKDGFWIELQEIHDSVDPADWEKELDAFYEGYFHGA